MLFTLDLNLHILSKSFIQNTFKLLFTDNWHTSSQSKEEIAISKTKIFGLKPN